MVYSQWCMPRPAYFRAVSFQLCFFYVPSPEAPGCCVGQVNRRYRSGCSRICYCRACSSPAAHHGSTCLPPHSPLLPGNMVTPLFFFCQRFTLVESGRRARRGEGGKVDKRHAVGRGGRGGDNVDDLHRSAKTPRSIATSHIGREEGTEG